MSDPPVNAHGDTPDQATAVPPLLSIEGVSVRFAGVRALTDVSFQVQPGELFAVIGPNGAGKTSLFNVLSRVYQPVAGRVTFDGHDLLRLKTHQVARMSIARTFQNLGQFPNTTVLDYLLLGRHTRMHSGILLGGIYIGMTRNEEKKNRSYCLHLLKLRVERGFWIVWRSRLIHLLLGCASRSFLLCDLLLGGLLLGDDLLLGGLLVSSIASFHYSCCLRVNDELIFGNIELLIFQLNGDHSAVTCNYDNTSAGSKTADAV